MPDAVRRSDATGTTHVPDMPQHSSCQNCRRFTPMPFKHSFCASLDQTKNQSWQSAHGWVVTPTSTNSPALTNSTFCSGDCLFRCARLPGNAWAPGQHSAPIMMLAMPLPQLPLLAQSALQQEPRCRPALLQEVRRAAPMDCEPAAALVRRRGRLHPILQSLTRGQKPCTRLMYPCVRCT